MDEEKITGEEENGCYGEIYVISNYVNEKLYIGQTTRDIKKRFKEHLYEDSAIGNAMRKYGIDHFRVDSIEKCYTKEQQNAFDIFWIRELGTLFPEGYNLTIGGEGANDFSGDIRRKISATKTGQPGHPQTEAEKAKRAASCRAYYETHPEAVETLRDRMRGNTYGTKQKGSKRTPEQRARMSAAQKNYRKNHPEAAQQHSERMKARYAKQCAEKAAPENSQRDEKKNSGGITGNKKIWLGKTPSLFLFPVQVRKGNFTWRRKKS